MKQLMTMLITAVFMLSSCSKETSTGPKTKAEITADSLQAVADSLAVMRNIHSMRAGYHLHQNKDLAEVAHQDPSKKARIRGRQSKGKDAKIKAAKRRNEQIKMQMEKMKDKTINENGN